MVEVKPGMASDRWSRSHGPRRGWRTRPVVAVLLLAMLVASAFFGAGLPGARAGARPEGHPLSLVVSDAAGASTPTVVLSIDHPYGFAPLQANITVTASGGAAPYNLTFCPSPTAGNCEMDAYWTGTPWPIREQFTTPGNYTVNASVIDAQGHAALASALVQVVAVAPLSAAFSEGAAQGVAPFAEAFNALVQGGVGPYSVTWSFGDGATFQSSAFTPVDHTYLEPGNFTPHVLIRDSRGTVSYRALPSVTVLPPPTSPGSPSLGGLPWASLALVAAWAVTAAAAIAGAGYVWRGRRLQREANELVRQLWEDDARGPEDTP